MGEVERLGRYRLLQVIATGGMGEVFLARQEGPAGFSKLAVVKRILRHLASDQTFVEMFLNEARLAARLSHPNIAQIFELGHEGDTYFLAMEYVHGKSVRSVCTRLAKLRAAWPPELAAWLGAQALQGLHHAHTLRNEAGELAGIIHRDVSPENILVSYEGNVKLVDFGIAEAVDRRARAGRLRGKLAYVAPEQIKGDALDGRTDIYATALTLYELLTGTLPYRQPLNPTDAEVVLTQPPVPLRQRNTRVPKELEEIVLTALAKSPADRFASAPLMAGALEGFIRKSGLEASAAKVAELLGQLFEAEAQIPLGQGGEGAVQATRGLGSDSALHTIIDRSRILVPWRGRLRTRSWLGGGAALVGVLALSATVAWRARGHAPSPPPPAATSAPPPSMTAPAATLAPQEPSPPSEAPAPSTTPADRPTPLHDEARGRARHASLGRVRVRVNPWAEVLLDGQKIGTTPMPPAEVAAGAHVLTLRNKDLGVERRIKVRVKSGLETLVKADLLEAEPSP